MAPIQESFLKNSPVLVSYTLWSPVGFDLILSWWSHIIVLLILFSLIISFSDKLRSNSVAQTDWADPMIYLPHFSFKFDRI